MTTLARKIIDAVQNLLLDKLLLRLLPLLWIVVMWDDLHPLDAGIFEFGAFVALPLPFLVAWALGALANRRPQPSSRSPYDRLHETPPNGFAAWDELPQGGLNPPRLLRTIVSTLGARPPTHWLTLAEALIFMTALAITLALSVKDPGSWGNLWPPLEQPRVRDHIYLAAVALMALVLLRGWAAEQRIRLEPEAPPPPSSGRSLHLTSGLILAATGGYIAFMMDRPVWWGLAAGAVLGLVLFGPPWRDHVADALFGKRKRADASS